MPNKYAKDQPAGFTNHIKSVAIVGASGSVGAHIVTALLANNAHQKITAITRSDSSSVFPAGVIVAKVNYNDPESLVSALKGHDVLVITMSVAAPPDTQVKLIDAAVTAGVPWVFPNEWGYGGGSESFIQEQMTGVRKKQVREYIESKGSSSWVSVGCGFWYELSLALGESTFGIDWSKKHVTWLDDGETRVTVSTLPQAGRGSAALLNLPILPEDENDKRTTLSEFRNNFARFDSFTINQKEIFASVLRVTGTKESEWTFSTEETKPRWERSFAAFQKDHARVDFGRAMYSRVFFPVDGGDMTNWSGLGKLDNDRLGLTEKEDIDVFTKMAIQQVESGQGLEYGPSTR